MTEIERYLYRYRNLERMKKILENELRDATEEYRAQQESLLMPAKQAEVKTSKTNKIIDPVQDTVIKIIDIYRKRVDRIANELQVVSGEQQSILDTVKQAGLSVPEESYIRYRYFKCMSACVTAQRIGYCERWRSGIRIVRLVKLKSTYQIYIGYDK